MKRISVTLLIFHLLVMSIFSIAPVYAEDNQPPVVRVGVLRNINVTQLSGAEGLKVIDQVTEEVLFETEPNAILTIRWNLVGVTIDSDNRIFVSAFVISNNGITRVHSNTWGTSETFRDFRGTFLVAKPSHTAVSMNLINYIPIDEYLYGVVPAEMPASWHIEALKAQAVAARTYMLINLANSKHSRDGYDLCATSCCQVYKGLSMEHINSNKAINDTKGLVIKYGGKMITTYYSSSAGGHTEDNNLVWSGTALPYLRGVNDDYYESRSRNPRYSWTVIKTPAEMSAQLASKGHDIGDILKIEEALPKSISGRQNAIKFTGTKGIVTISGQSNIRNTLGLFSAKFDITLSEKLEAMMIKDWTGRSTLSGINKLNTVTEVTLAGATVIGKNGKTTLGESVHVIGIGSSPSEITLKGGGWGHGVGMSQYGARGMADEGMKFDQILTFYYSGTDIVAQY